MNGRPLHSSPLLSTIPSLNNVHRFVACWRLIAIHFRTFSQVPNRAVSEVEKQITAAAGGWGNRHGSRLSAKRCRNAATIGLTHMTIRSNRNDIHCTLSANNSKPNIPTANMGLVTLLTGRPWCCRVCTPNKVVSSRALRRHSPECRRPSHMRTLIWYYYFTRHSICSQLLLVAAMALIATAAAQFIYTYPQVATYPSLYTYPAYNYPLAYPPAYTTLLRRWATPNPSARITVLRSPTTIKQQTLYR